MCSVSASIGTMNRDYTFSKHEQRDRCSRRLRALNNLKNCIDENIYLPIFRREGNGDKRLTLKSIVYTKLSRFNSTQTSKYMQK